MNLYREQIGHWVKVFRLSLGRVESHKMIYRTLAKKELDARFWYELQVAIGG